MNQHIKYPQLKEVLQKTEFILEEYSYFHDKLSQLASQTLDEEIHKHIRSFKQELNFAREKASYIRVTVREWLQHPQKIDIRTIPTCLWGDIESLTGNFIHFKSRFQQVSNSAKTLLVA